MTGSAIVPCANCHQRSQDVRLYRLAGVGLRPLDAKCAEILRSMGFDMKPSKAAA